MLPHSRSLHELNPNSESLFCAACSAGCTEADGGPSPDRESPLMASLGPGSGSASFSHGMDESLQTLPISCRFIPFDQWLVTHVNPKWKVRTIKYCFLKKCGAPQDFELPQPHRRPPSPIVFAQGPQKKKRAISPIQFAPTRPPSHINSDDEAVGYEEDDEESDADKPTIVHPQPNVNSEPEPPAMKRRVKTKSKVIHPHEISPYDPERLTLLRFSTGQSYIALGCFIRLPRTVLMPYVQPYWEGWVKALRVVGTPHRKNSDPEVQKLEWRPRWVVVRDGELSLCKDRSESPPSKSLSLSHLTDLRGAEHLVNSTAITPESNQRIICAKFKIRSTTTRVSYEAADQTAPSVTTITAQSKHLHPSHIRTSPSRKRASTISHTPVRPDGNASDSTDPDGEDSDTTLSSPVFAHEDMSDDELLGTQDHTLLGLRTSSYGYKYRGTKPIPPSTPSTPPNSLAVSTTSMHAQNVVPSPQNYEIGEWIVLDLPEDNAYTSLLRTLHRQFPHDTQTIAESSTFVSGLLPTLESPPQTPSWSPKYQQSQSSTHPTISTPSQSGKPGLPKSNALGAMPFPEWRTELVKRARRAGLGHIGDAMGCVLHALDPPSACNESMRTDDDETKVEVSTVREDEDSATVALQVDDDNDDGDNGDDDHDDGYGCDDDGDGVDFDGIDSDGDSDSSQVEWEGWMADLHRQARIVRAAPSFATTTASDDITTLSTDLHRLYLEPSGTVRSSPSWTTTISPHSVHTHTTLSSPSSNESLYNRHSRRVDSTRRPSMPSISIFANAHSRQDGSSSTAHSRQSSSLSQRPSMPSLGRAASVSVLKREKGKQREEDSVSAKKDKDRKKKHRLSNPCPRRAPRGQ
ncbi:hypothetical protein BDZ89DRAFT_1159794 [Hymenopellis radicata]|nr:hypothetical protein BDZ89DRAFT_1159794 [Hymenopellis radicata]